MKNSNFNPINTFDKFDANSPFGGKFWHGKVEQYTSDGKFLEFTVSDHLDANTEYNFRLVSKARAGFVTIFEKNNLTPKSLTYYLSKCTQNVQAWIPFENPTGDHKGLWTDVLAKKGAKFYSIDKSILESLTVSTMHDAFPKMVDYDLWNKVNAKTHADKAYSYNC